MHWATSARSDKKYPGEQSSPSFVTAGGRVGVGIQCSAFGERKLTSELSLSAHQAAHLSQIQSQLVLRLASNWGV